MRAQILLLLSLAIPLHAFSSAENIHLISVNGIAESQIDPNMVMKKVVKKKVEKHKEEDEDSLVYGRINILKKWNKLLDTMAKKKITKNAVRNQDIDPLSGVSG